MTDKPVAIRIARPHSTEDDYLTHELDTLTRSSVILVGANSRPAGVVLRFEVTLATGRPVLRGEGRVVEYKADAFRGMPGLVLRFTKLDPKSKQLVDRAHAMREGGGKISSPEIPVATGSEPSLGASAVATPAAPEAAPAPKAPEAEAPMPTETPTAPPPSAPSEDEAGAISVDLRGLDGRPTTPPPPPPPPTPADDQAERSRSTAPPPPGAEDAAGALPPTTPPPPESPTRRTRELPPEDERAALLARLRERRRTLSDETVSAIVADGARLRAAM